MVSQVIRFMGVAVKNCRFMKQLLAKIVILSVVFSTSMIADGNSVVFASTSPVITKIAAGYANTAALGQDGTVWTWGANGSGQLGDGTTLDSIVPVQVSNLSNVKDITTAGAYTLALKNDGTVWAWGSNYGGQLGDGTTTDSTVAVQVYGLSNVTAIAAGTDHAAALKSDGTVWTWGDNTLGGLGNGTVNNSSIPVQVSNLANVIAIAAGNGYTLALKNDGTVWAWGSNYDGELGTDQLDSHGSHIILSSLIPLQVPNLPTIQAIAAGGIFGAALAQDGTVWTWGNGGHGSFGIGASGTYTPVASGVSNVAAIAAGGAGGGFIVVRKNDNTVWAWGANGVGNLGNGTTIDSSVPVQVSGLSNVTAIAAGDSHGIAVEQDGSVWTWGSNTYGQLGYNPNGATSDNSYTPIKVAFPASTYVEPNDTMSQADSLDLNTLVTGTVGQDSQDWFKIVVPSDGSLLIKGAENGLPYGGPNLDYDLVDVNGNHYTAFNLNDVTPVNKATVQLESGTYYIHVYLDAAANTRYTLNTSFTPISNIQNVNTANGKVSVQFAPAFTGTPSVFSIETSPSASDFTVTQTINNGTPSNVAISGFNWDAANKLATFTIPNAEPTNADQSVAVSVSYHGEAPVAAPAYTVGATVAAVVYQPAAIQLTTSERSLTVNSTTTITGVVDDAYGKPVSNVNVHLSAEADNVDFPNSLNPVTVTTDNYGIFTSTFTAPSTPGTVTVTADAYGTTISNSVSITVTGSTSGSDTGNIPGNGGNSSSSSSSSGSNGGSSTTTSSAGTTTANSGGSAVSAGNLETLVNAVLGSNHSQSKTQTVAVTAAAASTDSTSPVAATIQDTDLQAAVQTSSANPTTFVMNIPAKQSQPVSLSLTANQVSTLKSANPADELVVTTANASLALPASVFQSAPAGASVQVSVTPSPQSKIVFQNAGTGATTVIGTPVSFEVNVVSGNTTHALTTTNTEITRSFLIDQAVDPGTSAVLYTEDGKTTYAVPATFTVNADGTTLVTVTRPGFSTYAVVSHSAHFADIAGSFAQSAIQTLADKLLIRGETSESFAPKANITRAEFAALVTRCLGLGADGSSSFSDVHAGDWYAQDIKAAYQAGLIHGMGDGTFHPNDFVTREDMAVMLAQAMQKLNLNSGGEQSRISYTDASVISAYALPAIKFVTGGGIMKGEFDRDGQAVFHPFAATTREQAAMVLYRLLQKAHIMN